MIPVALHRCEGELPFVKAEDDMDLQVLQVNLEAGLWVLRVRIKPGVTQMRHKHTGEVIAYTLSGSWKYLLYPEINEKGSYLYEPAGSVHTLHCLDSNTEDTDVVFVIRGANLYLDEDDNVSQVVDAAVALEVYQRLCAESGLGSPSVIGV